MFKIRVSLTDEEVQIAVARYIQDIYSHKLPDGFKDIQTIIDNIEYLNEQYIMELDLT
jgi:hypothetical protein